MFDANAHPTLDGSWLEGRKGANFREAEHRLRQSGFTSACAVALPSCGGYVAEAFAAAAKGDFWIPIAAWEPRLVEATPSSMQYLAGLGYRGVKVHPRLLGGLPPPEMLADLIVAAQAANLRVLICTYPFGAPQTGLDGNLLEVLSRALRTAPDARVMLLHGGCSEFLRYIDFARVHSSVLLDLSFTMTKYEGSSLDADLAFAFRTFDRRICLGTDLPECDPDAVLCRYEDLAARVGLDGTKRENITWRNGSQFFA